jgi:hypothetical protein
VIGGLRSGVCLPHAKHQHLITDIRDIYAEELHGLVGCDRRRIFKKKREFEQLLNGEVWQWKKVVLELLGNQEPLGRNVLKYRGEMTHDRCWPIHLDFSKVLSVSIGRETGGE